MAWSIVLHRVLPIKIIVLIDINIQYHSSTGHMSPPIKIRLQHLKRILLQEQISPYPLFHLTLVPQRPSRLIRLDLLRLRLRKLEGLSLWQLLGIVLWGVGMGVGILDSIDRYVIEDGPHLTLGLLLLEDRDRVIGLLIFLITFTTVHPASHLLLLLRTRTRTLSLLPMTDPMLQITLIQRLNQSLLIERSHDQLTLPSQQRFEPIFDGMFIAFILQFFRNGGPFLTVPSNKVNQREVLLLQPRLLEFGGVQMVEPPLAALLRRPEEPLTGLYEEDLAQVAPLESIVVPFDQLLEQLVLLMDPFLILVVLLQQVLSLVYEQLLQLPWKDLFKQRPIVGRIVLCLNSRKRTRSWMSIWLLSAYSTSDQTKSLSSFSNHPSSTFSFILLLLNQGKRTWWRSRSRDWWRWGHRSPRSWTHGCSSAGWARTWSLWSVG